MAIERPRRVALPTRQRMATNGEKVDYEITHLCGHTGLIQVFAGSYPDNSRWVQAQWDRDCRDCSTA